MAYIHVQVGRHLVQTAEQAEPTCSPAIVLGSMQALGYTVDKVRFDSDLMGWIVYTEKGPFF